MNRITKIILAIFMVFSFMTCFAFAGTDTNPPVIENVSIDKRNVIAGDVITVRITVTDESELSSLGFVFETKAGSFYSGYNVSYNWTKVDANTYETKMTVPDNLQDGEVPCQAIFAVDKYGNRTDLLDVSPYSIVVSGNGTDTNPPVIENVSIDKKSVSPGDVITVQITVTDESELSSLGFVFETKAGSFYSGYNMSYNWTNVDTNTYETKMTVPDNLQDGEVPCRAIFAVDKYGNRTDLTDVSLYSIYYHEHSWDNGVRTKEPTCTEDGVKTFTCLIDGCGRTKTEKISALGHDFTDAVTDPTCTEQGFTTHTCKRCSRSYTDSETNPLGHDWDRGEVTKEPTFTEEGVRLFTCKRCGIERSEPIKALTPPDKQSNTLTLKVTSKTYKQKNLEKKKATFSIGAKKAVGKVTYKLSKSAKKAKIKVSSSGKVTVPKKCKKGTFTINVRAAGDESHLAAEKTVKIKVK